MDIKKKPRCPNGTKRNKLTGNCEKNNNLKSKKNITQSKKIKNTKLKLVCDELREKPIFDILLVKDKKLFEKSLLKLKKRKKIETTKIK